MRPKLGIYIPVYGGWLRDADEGEEKVSYGYAEEVALKAEAIGIDSIWVPDHMLNPIKGEREPALEAWTTLTALGAVAKGLELFHTTICQGFRYPAVLAKMCATLQDATNGRFRLSIGAGWYKREFQAYEVPFHSHDERIDRTREQIEIIKALWKEDTVNYSGKYYTIKDGVMEPKPTIIPEMWWGGVSEPSRELTADECDGWLMDSSTVEEAAAKIEDMENRLEKRGRSGMKYAMPGNLVIGKSDDAARTCLKEMAGGKQLKQVLGAGFVGSPETIIERIGALSDIGMDYVILQVSPAMKSLIEFEEQVMPEL